MSVRVRVCIMRRASPNASARSQNMMQPKEDRLASKLVFICARCGITKDASNPCVYQNKLVTEAQCVAAHARPRAVVRLP